MRITNMQTKVDEVGGGKTQQKYPLKITRALREVQKKYLALLDSQLIGVAVSDGDEHIYKINQKFLNILGYTVADFNAGKITWSTITSLRYDRLDRIKLDELTSFSVVDLFEKEYIHKNGESIPVVVGAELISEDPPMNITLVLDVSKQKKAEKEKEDMISIIGHEIKTPLSVLRIQADLLCREAQQGISQKKLVKTLKEFDNYIVQIDTILSEIITFNKVRDRVSPAKSVNFDVSVTVKQVVSDIKLLSDRKITIVQAGRDCLVCGNETEIREIVMNLISNALRYSQKETSVEVAVWCENKVVKIAVKDNGRGIAKADQKKIFLKSYQARHPDGTANDDVLESSSRGLGLYLCHQIAKRHGGKITVESELNKGSVFTCILPAGLCPSV